MQLNAAECIFAMHLNALQIKCIPNSILEFWRCINAVRCIKKRLAARCMQKMQEFSQSCKINLDSLIHIFTAELEKVAIYVNQFFYH